MSLATPENALAFSVAAAGLAAWWAARAQRRLAAAEARITAIESALASFAEPIAEIRDNLAVSGGCLDALIALHVGRPAQEEGAAQ